MAVKVIRKFRLLFDVDWGTPLDGWIPIYNAGLDKLVMTSIAAGGGFSLGLSNVGNTAGDTGVTGSRVVLAGLGAINASQATDANGATISLSAPPQTVQTQNVHNVTLDGNTDGVLAEISSGTMTLAGGPHITLSQNGNAISIVGAGVSAGVGGIVASDASYTSGTVSLLGSGDITVETGPGQQIIIHGSQSVQPETQTFVGGVANSQTTYTSGTIKLSELGAVTIRSTTGQQLQISVAAQSVQPETQTFVGGIAGSNTTYTSGTVSLVGSGMVTVQSGTGQRLIINATQSVQPETQTFIGGIAASDTTYTSGTVRISGVGGGVTVSSNTGQRVDISVAAPVAQTGTQFSAGISGGNTAGDTGTVAGRLVLAGGANITLSGSTNGASETVSIVGGSAAAFSGGVSNLGNTVGSTGATGTRLVFAGGQSVTLSQSTDANGGTITISGASTSQSVQTQNLHNVTLSGNTAGVMAQISSGTMTLAGGNSITLSQNGNAITISGATTSQSVQTQDRFDATISGNTAGAGQLVSSGTLTLAGGNNITLSQAGNAITISGANIGGAQTGISGIANSQTTYTSGTVSLSELGAITIRSTTGNQFQLSVAAQTAESQSIGMSNLGNTSGTTGIASGAQVRFLLAGGNNITLSQSLNGASGTITISAPTQTVESQSIGMSNVGNTSGTTGMASGGQVRFVLAGGNNVTLSQSLNGASGTITISAGGGGAFSAGVSNVGNTSGDTGITGSRLVLSGGQSITLSQSTNASGATVGISGASTSQSVQSLGMYAVQNTTGQSSSTTMDARTLSIAGDGAVSVGYSGGSLRISAPTQTVESQSIGMSNVGNTSGTTGVASGAQVRFVLAGGNNITLSQSLNGASGTLTISAPNQSAQSLGMYAVQNTTGQSSSTTMDARTLSIAGDGIVSVGYSGGSLRISATEVPQTNQTLGLYALGNTTGQSSSTTRDARSLSVEGAGIVSVGYSGGSLRISATQSVQPETQTFVGGLANSETTYTSGTVKLSELGAITIRSTTGNQFQLSVNSQTVQTQNLHNVTLSGNTSGVMAQISSGTMTLAGGNNITLSQNGNAITISGPNAGGAQTGISGIIGSDATYTSGTVQFTGSNIVTIRSSAGQRIVVDATDTDRTSINQVTHGLAVGDWVRLNGTSYVKAQADSEANAEVVGVVSAVADADNFTLITGGLITGLSGLTAGAVYYLSDATPGAITSTEPTTPGSISKPVLIARTTTSGYVFNMRGNIIPASAITAFLAGLSNIGNTAGDTGITGSRLVLAGGNNITLSGSTNASGGTVTISAPNLGAGAMSAGVSNVGNTSGDTGITGTRLVLAGGNAITLSQSTNASGGTVTISAPSQTVESQSIGMSNVGNTSGTTGMASGGQVRFVLAGGNNITLSQSLNGASGTITISAPNTAAQTDQTLGMYAVGNTTGQSSSTTRDARSISVDAAGIVSAGYSAGSLRISATQSAQSLGMYAVQNTTGQSSSTTMDARTLSIAGDGAASVGYSAGSLRISAPPVSLISAVAPLSTTTNGSTISILAPAQFSAGLSTVGNTSGDTGVVSGRVVLAGGNGITLSGSTNAGSMSITISGGGGGAFSAGASNVGNTSGDTGITGSRLVLAGGQSITLSQSTNASGGTITISGASTSQSVQSLGMYAVQNTTGQSSSTTMDARTLSVAGDGAVSVGYSGGSLRISAPVQTGTQFSGGISGGNTAGDTGTVAGRLVLAGGANITLSGSTNGASETVSIVGGAGGAFSAGVSNVGNTSGDTGITGSRLVLAGGNAITLSQSTNASGGTVTISAPTQSAESQSIGMSNLGNTSGTTGIASGAQVRMLFAGGNNVTLSQSLNGASGTLTISAASQTVQTQNVVDVTLSGNTAGAMALVSSGTLTLAGGNNITLSQAGNAVTISGPNTAAQTVESQSIGMSNLGNTSGTTGIASGGQVRFVFAGGNNITLSQSLNGASGTITISAPNLGAGAMSAGVSTMGNTAGSTGVTGTRLVLVGTNAISLSQSTDANGGTISVNAPATSSLVGASGVSISTNGSTISVYNTLSQSIGMSNLGNTAGTTGMASADRVRFVIVGSNNITLSQSLNGSSGTISIIGGGGGGFSAGVSTGGNTAGATGVSGSQMVLVGSGPISLSQTTGANGNTVSVLGPAASVISAVAPLSTSTNGSTISILGPAVLSVADWENMPRAQASLISHVSAFSKTPIYWNDHIYGDVAAKSLAFAISMVTASQPLSVSAHLGVYTLVNSTSAALLGSVSEAYVVSSATSVSLSGVRNVVMTGIGTHTALSKLTGGEYVFGMMFSATATNVMNFSLLGASGGPGPLGGIYPGTNQVSAGTNQGIQTLAGRGSATVNAMPANVVASDIINQGTAGSMALHPWIYIRS